MKEDIKKKRLSNIELLRIIAMFFIVCHHMLNYSGLGRENTLFCIINTFVSPCVNIFVLISGYFLVDSKFKVKKITKLYLQIVFYYMFCTLFFRYVFNVVGVLHKEDLISAVFPILYPQEWFSISYMILYILSPFLNKMLHNINKKEHIGLIVTLIIFAYLQRFPGFSSYLDFNYGYSISWFITLYVVAAFIKFYYKKENHQKYILYRIIAVFATIFIFYKFQINNIYLTPLFISGKYIAYSSILVLTLSILIFILFLNIDIKNEKLGKIINKCSATTFAIYLMHSTNFSRVFFENLIKQGIGLFGYKLLPVVVLIIILLIFECGILVELFRQFIEKKVEKILNKLKCEVKR